MVFVFILAFNSLHISATAVNETVTEDSNTELVGEEEASVASSGEGLGHPDNHGEVWYMLDYNAPKLGNQTIDYNQMSELLTYLKPGDIIYETNDSIVGDITKHIAIVYDILWDEEHQQYYVSIIEAYTGGVGYGIMTPNRFEEKNVIIYRLTNASEVQIQNALIWLKDKCGDNFLFHPRKFLDGLQINDETYWYCAELIWAAFMEQGIGLDPDNNEDNGPIILPQKLASYEYLTTILHYTDENDEEKYKTTLTNNGTSGHTYTCDGDTYTEEHDFVYESVDGVNHSISCFCGYTITVPHEYTYTRINWDTHLGTCICGHTVTENHSLEYEQLGDSESHKETCMLCEHSGIDSHNYKCYGTLGEFHSEACIECGYAHMGLESCEYVSIDENSHSVICPDCEHSVATEAHNWAYTSVNALSHEKYCADCGYVSDGLEVHSWTPYNLDYVKCSYCGFLKKKTGNIIIPVQPAKQDDDYSE